MVALTLAAPMKRAKKALPVAANALQHMLLVYYVPCEGAWLAKSGTFASHERNVDAEVR